jgi:DNA polymerase III sliding clamp (beta) subunit (PCNA family)
MNILDLQQTLAKPGQVTWQGQTLAEVLAGDTGLDALKTLANGGEGDFREKLAAALLVAGAEGWKVYRPTRRRRASRKTSVSLTGKLLEAATREVNRVVSQKATLAVMRCALVVQAEGTLAIAGTDMDTTLIVRLPFGGPGLRAAVDAKDLQQAFKAAGKRQVSLALDGSEFTVQGGGKTALQVEPVEEFPSPDLGPVLATATVSLPHLAGVARSIASDDSRPTLASLFIGYEMRCPACKNSSMVAGPCFRCEREKGDDASDVEPVESVMVSADGFRMGFCGVDLPPEFPNALIPGAAVRAMLKAVDGDEIVIAIHGSGKDPETPRLVVMRAGARNRALAKAGAEVEVVARLTEGTFPNYRQIVPANEHLPRSFRVGTQDLADAAKAIKPVAKEAADIAFVQTEGEGVRIWARTCEGALAERDVVAADVAEPSLLALNVDFIADAGESLAALGAVVAVVRSGEPVFRNGLWHPNSTPYLVEGPITWVIMPMHVRDGVAWQGVDPGPALEYAEPLAREALAEASALLGYALTPAHTKLATEAMASAFRYDRLTAIEAAGWLDALRAKAQEVARSALEAYAATYHDRDSAEITDELVERTADKMLRTCRYRPFEETLTESKARAAAGWK